MDARELKRALKKSGFTQRELARAIGVTDTAVSLWMSGKRKMHPAFGTLIRQAVEKKGAAA